MIATGLFSAKAAPVVCCRSCEGSPFSHAPTCRLVGIGTSDASFSSHSRVASNEAFAFEKENYQLKMEIKILKNKVEGLEKAVEINSNGYVSTTTSDSEDVNEIGKEEINLD